MLSSLLKTGTKKEDTSSIAGQIPIWEIVDGVVIGTNNTYVQGFIISGVDVSITSVENLLDIKHTLENFINNTEDGRRHQVFFKVTSKVGHILDAWRANENADYFAKKLFETKKQILEERAANDDIFVKEIYLFYQYVPKEFDKKIPFTLSSFNQVEKERHDTIINEIRNINQDYFNRLSSDKLKMREMEDEEYFALQQEYFQPLIQLHERDIRYQYDTWNETTRENNPHLMNHTIREQLVPQNLALRDKELSAAEFRADDTYFSIVTLTQRPTHTDFNETDLILNMGFPYFLVFTFEPKGNEEAVKAIQNRKNITTALNKHFKGDDTREALQREYDEFLNVVIEERHKVPMFDMSVVIFDKNRDELRRKVQYTANIMRINMAKAAPIEYGVWQSFLNLMPGSPLKFTLPHSTHTPNIANLLPVRKEVFGAYPPVIITETEKKVIKGGDPFFSPDNYNRFTVGPSGTGKSSLMVDENVDYMAKGYNVMMCDNGYSQKYAVKILGGDLHIFNTSGRLCINPLNFTKEQLEETFSTDNTDDKKFNAITFANSQVRSLLTSQGHKIETVQGSMLTKSLTQLLSNAREAKEPPLLHDLQHMIEALYPNDPDARILSIIFDSITGDTPQGTVFDRQTNFKLNPRYNVVDFKEVESMPEVFQPGLMATMSMFYHKVSENRGERKLIRVDEGASIIKYDFGQMFLEIFYRTIRKLNGGIDFTTQTLEDMNIAGIKGWLVPNCAYMHAMGIPKGQEEQVKRFFDLSDSELETLKKMKPVPGKYSKRLNYTPYGTFIQVNKLKGLRYWIATSNGEETHVIDNLAEKYDKEVYRLTGIEDIRRREQYTYFNLLSDLGDLYPHGLHGLGTSGVEVLDKLNRHINSHGITLRELPEKIAAPQA